MGPGAEAAVILTIVVLSSLALSILGLRVSNGTFAWVMCTLVCFCCVAGAYLAIGGRGTGTHVDLALFTAVLWCVCLGLGHSLGKLCLGREGVGEREGEEDEEGAKVIPDAAGGAWRIHEMHLWRITYL